MIGLSASARKSHLVQRTDAWLQEAAPEPDTADVKDPGLKAIKNRTVFVQEATAKGFRLNLLNYQRACLHTDEIVNVFKSVHNDPTVVRHWADKAKLNNYLLSEPDDMTSGKESTHIGLGDLQYVISFKCTGQSEVVEDVVQPPSHAFQKRVSLAWVPDDLEAVESLNIQGSDKLVSDLHKWLFDKVADKPIGKVCLDGFCLDIYGAVKEAVDQFKKEAAGATAFTKFHRVKVDFFHTDILRYAMVSMRKCQFLTSLNPGAHDQLLEEFPLFSFWKLLALYPFFNLPLSHTSSRATSSA